MILPVEIWLKIFKYTDNNTFRKILACLFSADKEFAKKLYSMICLDIIKHNKQILLMNSLMNQPSQYRKMDTYMNFKYHFANSGVGRCEKAPIPYPHEHYKNFIDKYPHLCFKNEKDIELFKHLTNMNLTCAPINIDVLFYYTNSVPIQDIIKYTKDIALPI